jgi:hypothetical protein
MQASAAAAAAGVVVAAVLRRRRVLARKEARNAVASVTSQAIGRTNVLAPIEGLHVLY